MCVTQKPTVTRRTLDMLYIWNTFHIHQHTHTHEHMFWNVNTFAHMQANSSKAQRTTCYNQKKRRMRSKRDMNKKRSIHVAVIHTVIHIVNEPFRVLWFLVFLCSNVRVWMKLFSLHRIRVITELFSIINSLKVFLW